MSIEIFLFPEAGTKSELSNFFVDLGYIKFDNPFWSGSKDALHFFWEDIEDFKSTSGIDASVFELDEQGRAAWEVQSQFCIHTRTSIWASSFDRNYQNETVRRARKKFKGKFFNDHFGINRYIPVDTPISTPASRGLYALTTKLTNELRKLEYSVPTEIMETLQWPNGRDTEVVNNVKLLEVLKQQEPSRVIYNALIPFLVAVIEHFFRESFEILLKYDLEALSKITKTNRKVTIYEASALANGETTLERIVSDWYSFQNLQSVQKAFEDAFNINIMKVLHRRKRVKSKLPLLSKALSNLISTRHGVIHHLSLNYQIERDEFLDLLHLVLAIIQTVAQEFEKRLGVELGAG